MEFFHTSTHGIDEIGGLGRFNEFLFFACEPYSMGCGDYITYKLELDENNIIESGSLFYHKDADKLDGVVARFCNRFDVDTETAEEVISERQQLELTDPDDLWDIQIFTANAAKALGFRAVAVRDEQGTAYMIDMEGREDELEQVG